MSISFDTWLNQAAEDASGSKGLERQSEALQRAKALGKPTVKQEIWKYAPIESLLNELPWFQENPSQKPAPIPGHLLGSWQYRDEAFCHKDASGWFVASLAYMNKHHPDTLHQFFGAAPTREDDVFAELNTGQAQAGLFFYVPKGLHLNAPLSWLDEGPDLDPVRCIFHLEEDASMALDYRLLEGNALPGLLNHAWEIHLDRGAKLSLYRKLAQGTHRGLVHHTLAKLHAKSCLEIHTSSLDARFQRLNYFVDLCEEEAHAEIIGLQAPELEQHINTRVDLRHLAPNCTSHQEYRSISRGKAQAVFSGKILVARDAQKTLAYQHAAGLILDEQAKVYAKPVLEIYADDVKCSHGATTGQLNEDALFYLRARGISEAQSRRMLTEAFYGSVLDKLPQGDLKEEIENDLRNKWS